MKKKMNLVPIGELILGYVELEHVAAAILQLVAVARLVYQLIAHHETSH